MGSLNSLATALVPAVTGNAGLTTLANWAVNGIEDASNNSAAIKSEKLAMQQAQADANKKLAELEQKSADAEADRLKTLKATIAKQKASFGGSGLSNSDSGSTQSVIKGFLSDSEDEKEKENKLTSLKKQAIEDSLTANNRQSLLEIAQLNGEHSLSNILF